jgi:hypothetical protein
LRTPPELRYSRERRDAEAVRPSGTVGGDDMPRMESVCGAFIGAALALTVAAHAKVDPKTIMGLWLLDEGQGDVAKDSSGNANHGKVVGAKWVKGRNGSALEFDGASHVQIPASATTDDYRNGFSYMLWVKPAGAPGNPNTRLIERNWHNPTIQIGAADFYGSVVAQGGIGNGIRGGAHRPGEWSFVALTHDGKTLQLYADGKKVNESKVGQPDMTRDADGGAIWLGQWKAPGWDYRGVIDEAAVFNAPLSEADLAAIMANGFGNVLSVRPAGKVATTWAALRE